jgi:hypothetical protein
MRLLNLEYIKGISSIEFVSPNSYEFRVYKAGWCFGTPEHMLLVFQFWFKYSLK